MKYFRFSLFNHATDRFRIKIHRAVRQVRYIERTKAVFIMPWVFLRQHERLCQIAVFIHMAEIWSAVFSVSPLAGKNEPAA